MGNPKTYQAVVETIIRDGKHGPYAVATCKGLGQITFSLANSVWKEDDWPERGMWVVLWSLRRKRAGWRAQNGRYLEPSDEATSKE